MYRKGFIHILVILLISALLLAGGYFWLRKNHYFNLNPNVSKLNPTLRPTSTKSPNPTPYQISSNTNCELFENSNFKSVDKHEGGLGPNGAVMGSWQISFGTNNKFSWQYSDVVQSGSYTCQKNNLNVKVYDRTFTAKYDPNTGILTWDGVDYIKTN